MRTRMRQWTFLLIFFYATVALSATIFGVVKRVYSTSTSSVLFSWEFDSIKYPDVIGFKLYVAPTSNTSKLTTISINGKDIRKYTWSNFPNGQFLSLMTAIDKYGNESRASDTIQLRSKRMR